MPDQISKRRSPVKDLRRLVRSGIKGALDCVEEVIARRGSEEAQEAEPASGGETQDVTTDSAGEAQEAGDDRAASDADQPSIDELIHAARKHLKNARGDLRLLRSTLGKRRYQRENAALRDAARPLTELRDAKVVLNALLDLQSGEAAQLDAELLDQLTECLRQRRAELIDPAMLTHPAAVVADSSADANANADSGGQDVDPCGSGSGEAMERGAPAADDVAPPADLLLPAAQILKAALRRSKRWPRDGHGWRSIAKGIRRVYGAGRETMEVARRNPSVDHLHEWRKQAKYLRSQLEAVEPILPKVLCGLIEQARLIGDHLGDNHDLALLAQIVGGEFSTARDAGTLLTMIDQRRDQLASRAMSIGLELYRLKPDAFVARLRKPWHAWRHA